MDPVTHGLVGLALGSMTGDMNPFTNPMVLGSLIGSMIPDGDIIYQYWGDYVYLKNHRGISHSIPGIAALSFIVAGIIRLFFTGYSFSSILLWTLMGCLSHIGLDIFNSYGASILWPIKSKKIGLGLLMIFDPLLVICALGVYFNNIRNLSWTAVFVGLFAFYMMFRALMAKKIEREVKKRFSDFRIEKVVVLPSSVRMFYWDFIVQHEEGIITGFSNFSARRLKVRSKLNKTSKRIEDAVMNSPLGEFFKAFSPYFYIECSKHGDHHHITLTDLRYYMRNLYLHHATALFDQKMELVDCAFHPYSLNRRVKIPM